MFYSFFAFFTDQNAFFNIFQYITFRALLAGILSFFIVIFVTPRFIRLTEKNNFKENISNYLEAHKIKKGTPNMGGIVIALSIIISSILFGNFNNSNFL